MRGTVGATPLVLLVLSAPVGPKKTPTSVQPVIPFRLSDEWNFISRTILREEQGLIARRRDQRDRRASALHLTAAGRNALEQIGQVARQHDDEICAALTLEERQQLNALLGRIADHQRLTPGVHPGFQRLGRKRITPK